MSSGPGERRDYRRSRMLGSSHRFKLATFGFNAQGGVTITKVPGTVDTDWAQQVRIAQASEAAGIDAIIPGARWRGYGGETNFQGRSYETLTWAAGLGAATSAIDIFATVHFTTVHPVRLAKMMATADHISGGRLAINWVAGWNAEEIAMFGGTQREHDQRYEYAEEYLELLNQLLDRPGHFEFHGRFFDLADLYSEPKPIQAPRPAYMAAGVSPRGRRFAAEHAELNFALPHGDVSGAIAETKRMANDIGRQVKVVTQATVVCADSETEAREYHDWYVNQHGDRAAADNMVRAIFGNTRDENGNVREVPQHIQDARLRASIEAHGGKLLIGTPTQVVEGFLQLADKGFDGSTISWVDYEAGIAQYREKILPLMIQAGLRSAESDHSDEGATA